MSVRIEEEEVLNFWKNCEYCEQTHYEYDTGYSEYGCCLLGNPHDVACCEEHCPLDYKVRVEFDR